LQEKKGKDDCFSNTPYRIATDEPEIYMPFSYPLQDVFGHSWAAFQYPLDNPIPPLGGKLIAEHQ